MSNRRRRRLVPGSEGWLTRRSCQAGPSPSGSAFSTGYWPTKRVFGVGTKPALAINRLIAVARGPSMRACVGGVARNWLRVRIAGLLVIP